MHDDYFQENKFSMPTIYTGNHSRDVEIMLGIDSPEAQRLEDEYLNRKWRQEHPEEAAEVDRQAAERAAEIERMNEEHRCYMAEMNSHPEGCDCDYHNPPF